MPRFLSASDENDASKTFACPLSIALLLGLALLHGVVTAPALDLPPAAARPLDSVNEDKRSHWSFQAPVRPPLPPVKNQKWVRNAIDPFILARLEKEGLSPSPEADRVTLIRRLSLDLIGLPPTLEEVDAVPG